MRTRQQIESNILPFKSRLYASKELERFAVLMEVLLDIRELLQPISNEASLHLQAKESNN